MSSSSTNQWEMGADGRWTNNDEAWTPALRSGGKGKGHGSTSGKGHGSSLGRSSKAWTDWELTEAAGRGRGSESTPDKQRERLGVPFSAWNLCDSRGLVGEEPVGNHYKTWGAQSEGGAARSRTSRRGDGQEGRGSDTNSDGWHHYGWTNWQSASWSSAKSDSWRQADPPSSRAYTGSEPELSLIHI